MANEYLCSVHYRYLAIRVHCYSYTQKTSSIEIGKDSEATASFKLGCSINWLLDQFNKKIL